VKTIIYEKKLEELKPSHISSKIMAHELKIMPKSKKVPQEKPQELSSRTTSHDLSSQQEKVMSRMATHGSSREDDGDDEDSSSDEEVESMVSMYVNKIFKYVKKINMYGYNVHLREGRHHQHIMFTKIEYKTKKKVVKERMPKQEAIVAIREWISGAESSSCSSSDESRKNFTIRFMQGPSSSPHMCLMAQGMDSNVSDGESDTTSLDDLVELVHEQKGMLKKQANEIKELNALNDLSATLATNYEHLLCKFKLLGKECDELKSKLEKNDTKTSNSFELNESSIPCAIPISKVDALTSCIDLIDESCSPSCNENIVVEKCDCLIGKKNDELKEEVKWLRKRLASLMGKSKKNEEQVDISQDKKSKVQPSQDNRDPMVKKLEKGAIVTCYKCHGEGHKFYKCPQFVKKTDKGEKKKLNPTIKSSLIYTKPDRKNKTKSNTYVIKKKANGKVVAHKVGKMKEERCWNQLIWVPKEVIINMKGPQMVWVPKAT
jgi:hypothetical protein